MIIHTVASNDFFFTFISRGIIKEDKCGKETIAFCLPFALRCVFKRLYQEMRAKVAQTAHTESWKGGRRERVSEAHRRQKHKGERGWEAGAAGGGGSSGGST